MLTKKKIIQKPHVNNHSKPDIATRAEITANLKFTRGKQLVEHEPISLIPDPQNPRPGEIINDAWLFKNLKLNSQESLCKLDSESKEYIIPEYSQLNLEDNEDLEESYNFLRNLAFSLRNDGLIEPIEVFLADKNNDPDYFMNTNLEYGYVILEGHQRRLAAIMASMKTITCIEITDESMLAKLKIKHRKLRRQLSENNLRKPLTVANNFEIVKRLLADPDNQAITTKELATIIGLNQGIAGALKNICLNANTFPEIFITKIMNNELTFKVIRILVAKSPAEIAKILNNYSAKQTPPAQQPKPRGKQGGAIKRSAIFKIKSVKESCLLQKFLLSKFPELEDIAAEDQSFHNLEKILDKIKELALKTEN